MVAKIARKQLVEVFTSVAPQSVHVFLPSDFELQIPHFVLSFFAKGCKCIPDMHHSHIADIYGSLPALERQLHLIAYFKFNDAHGEARVPSRCRLPSTWVPPGDPNVDVFMRRLRTVLLHYQPRRQVRNLLPSDRKAIKLLNKHRNRIAVCDTDKNLGDAMFSRTWVHAASMSLLHESFDEISYEDYHAQSNTQRQNVLHLVDHYSVAKNAVSKTEANYVCSRLHLATPGNFRIRPKIHKLPTLKARPVVNLRQHWAQPLAVFITEKLTPVMSCCKFVIFNADQVSSSIGGRVFKSRRKLWCVDVVNLYPCIPHNRILEKLSPILLRCLQRPLAEFLLKAIELLLANQDAEYNGIIYKNKLGIATGLACGVQIANIFLSDCDQHVVARLWGSLGLSDSDLEYFGRFVDDALVIGDADIPDSDILEAFNSWLPEIHWEITGSGDSLAYLDLRLSLANGFVNFELFRKPLHIYQYIPYGSAHPSRTFQSLVTGESLRILRRCREGHTANKELQFFKHKLLRRGLPVERVLTHQSRARVLFSRGRPGEKSGVRKAFLKLEACSSLSLARIHAALSRACGLPAAGRGELRGPRDIPVATCLHVQRNIFRLTYASAWRWSETFVTPLTGASPEA